MRRKNRILALVWIAGCIWSSCAAEVTSKAYRDIWNPDEQRRIDADIEANRKADGEFVVSAPAGTEVSVEQLTHEFRFGAHIFNFDQLGNRKYNERYKAMYGDGGLFNGATVAFYWKQYEPDPGRFRAHGGFEDTERFWNGLTREEASQEMFWRRPAPGPVISFCRKKGVRIHGHVLIWGNERPDWIYDQYCPESEKTRLDAYGFPRFGRVEPLKRRDVWLRAWSRLYDDATESELGQELPVFSRQMKRLFRKRIFDVARDFGDLVDSWDVVNESSCCWKLYGKSRTNLPVWKSRDYGLMPGDYPLQALLDAKEAFPEDAKLAVNDWNVRPEFLDELRDLESEGAKIDVVGCQMHIFADSEILRLANGETDVKWVATPGMIRERLDMMARFGRAIHISEVTIAASGDGARDRQIQAELTRNILRAWFSHPAVRGVTWWNTVDGGGARGEPSFSGLLDSKMEEKPVYRVLDQLINHDWRTRQRVRSVADSAVTAASSVVAFRGFRGKYLLSWTDADGNNRRKYVVLTGTRSGDVTMPGREVRIDRVERCSNAEASHLVGRVLFVGPVPKSDAPLSTSEDLVRQYGRGRQIEAGEDGWFDFRPLVKESWPVEEDPAFAGYVVIRVNSPDGRVVRFCEKNDWYGSISVNGKPVVTRLDGEKNHWQSVRIRLERGVNEIVFRTTPGCAGKWISMFAFDDPKRELGLEE